MSLENEISMIGQTASKDTRKRAGAPAHRSFPEDYLGYQLARASHLVTTKLHEQLEGFGVSVSTWRILTAVLDQERTIGEVGRLVLMKQSALSRALDRIEEDGLIARKRIDSKRRVVYIRLTPAGRKLAETLRATAGSYEKKFRSLFSPGDLQQLSALLDQIISKLSEQE
jgi:MarR family transcriptional regulator, organic hydroperoxide resistance regulator